jgi:metal-responsive CopG/Arc/MetJ family transcriptional regulator
MRKRVNIPLPEETLELIERVTEHGDRSRFIDEAVKHYVEHIGRTNLRSLISGLACGLHTQGLYCSP